VDLEGKDVDHMGVVRIPPVEPIRLNDLIIDDPEEKYTKQENMMFMKQPRQAIDRSILPTKIVLRKEKVQEGINSAEYFLNLDIEAVAKIEDTNTEILIPEEPTTKIRPQTQDFRKQFEKLKNIRK
jgi:hypothetical protein